VVSPKFAERAFLEAWLAIQALVASVRERQRAVKAL
jgi:hypothetical protein